MVKEIHIYTLLNRAYLPNVIKHSGHLGTLEKCRKHSPAARVFYISLVFSNARRVLSQCNTRLRLLYLLNINSMNKNFAHALR